MNNDNTEKKLLMNENDAYKWMLSIPAFYYNEISKLTGDKEKASHILRSLKKRKLITHVRKNMYTTLDNDGCPVWNDFQIASRINDECYLSHHSALEYYAAYNQYCFVLFISSNLNFKSFEYEGRLFTRKKSNLDIGIIEENKIRVTDKERTIIESIKDSVQISGIEEVIRSLGLIGILNEDKLIKYLEVYNNKLLWRKTGYLLSEFPYFLCQKFSNEFYKTCQKKGTGKPLYLKVKFGTSGYTLNKEWNIYVPKNIHRLFAEEEMPLV